MQIPSVTGLNRSPVQYFLESSWQGKAVQILFAISFVSLIYYVASRFIKRDEPASPGPATLNNRVVMNETPASQALSSKTLSPWLKEITQKTWEEKIDCERYGLVFTDTPQINGSALANGLKALSERVEGNMGITNMVIPKGLTLNTVLLIAKDYKVPISSYWYDQIITEFGDVPAKETGVLFFTNSILTGTRNHTPDQHDADVTTIGEECKVAIQRPNVRDFMAFLILTYLSSPEDLVRFYSLATYTRLSEKAGARSLFGGFAASGLSARSSSLVRLSIGVGASGSSENTGL